MKQSMLTTTDNPFNPFDEYDQWLAYDGVLGHNTLSFLARILVTSPDLSEADASQAIEDAIDEIIEYNVNGKYVKVTREEASDPSSEVRTPA